VKENVERGGALVRALDGADFPVIAAVWIYYPDNETWRLVLATPKAKDPQQAYTEIRRIIDRAGVDAPDLAQIRLVFPTDPMIATLSRAVRVEGLSGVRFSKNMINGIYVDDAYIYRTAA
jgi:hypothetical protein